MSKRELGDGEPSPEPTEILRCPHCNSPARKIDWCHGYRVPHICPTDHIDHQRPDLYCNLCGGLLININESEDEDAEEILVCANFHSHNRSGAAQEVSPRIISRETFPELGGETTVEVFEEVSPPSPEQERDQLLFALGCQLGGVKSALEVIDAKNEFIEKAEGDTRELKAARPLDQLMAEYCETHAISRTGKVEAIHFAQFVIQREGL